MYILFIQDLRWLTTIYNCFLQLPFTLEKTPATQASKTKQNFFWLLDPSPLTLTPSLPLTLSLALDLYP